MNNLVTYLSGCSTQFNRACFGGDYGLGVALHDVQMLKYFEIWPDSILFYVLNQYEAKQMLCTNRGLMYIVSVDFCAGGSLPATPGGISNWRIIL